MTCKQRLFSHELDLNYADYNKNKKGSEILKTLKEEYNNNKSNHHMEEFCEINKFKTHEDFLTLSKAYYNHLYNEKCTPTFVKNMYNANITSVDKEEQPIINDCTERNEILYPYGEYTHQQKCDFFYPYKIDISKWCSQKKESCEYPEWLGEYYPICAPQPHSPSCSRPVSISIPIHQNVPIHIPIPTTQESHSPPRQLCKPSPLGRNPISKRNYTPIQKSKPVIIFAENRPFAKQKCEKHITNICKRGFCENCNKKKKSEKCHCHNNKEDTTFFTKKIKTGVPF